MALGTCRHCHSHGIATDAPMCRACGGWFPNPGLITRLGVVLNRVVACVMLLASALITLAAFASGNPGIAMIAVPLVFGGGAMLLKSFLRPYGQVPRIQ